MGQYYMCINTDKKEKVDPYCVSNDFNGAKLMEHSYTENPMPSTVMNLLSAEWKGDKIIWVGDYTELEENGENLYSYASKHYTLRGLSLDKYNPNGEFQRANNKFNKKLKYIANMDQKKFVNIEDVPDGTFGKVHPMPILCVNPNHSGGAYHSEYGEEYIGTWAGDRLFSTSDLDDLKEYKEVKPNFKEY